MVVIDLNQNEKIGKIEFDCVKGGIDGYSQKVKGKKKTGGDHVRVGQKLCTITFENGVKLSLKSYLLS